MYEHFVYLYIPAGNILKQKKNRKTFTKLTILATILTVVKIYDTSHIDVSF